jgi:hypothetical protein
VDEIAAVVERFYHEGLPSDPVKNASPALPSDGLRYGRDSAVVRV